LIVGAIRASKRAVATPHRQKTDNDDQEKFDCDGHARRFDLIRSSRQMLLFLALSHARKAHSVCAMTCFFASESESWRPPQYMGKSGIKRTCVGCCATASRAQARGGSTE
jgi:hypothetical protein